MRALMCAVHWTKWFTHNLTSLNNSGKHCQVWRLEFREAGPQVGGGHNPGLNEITAGATGHRTKLNANKKSTFKCIGILWT